MVRSMFDLDDEEPGHRIATCVTTAVRNATFDVTEADEIDGVGASRRD